MLYMHKMPSDILHTRLTHFIFGMVSQLFSSVFFLFWWCVICLWAWMCVVFVFSPLDFQRLEPNRISFFSLRCFVDEMLSLLYIIYSRQIGLIIVGKSRRCRFCISSLLFFIISSVFLFPSLYRCFSFELWFFFIFSLPLLQFDSNAFPCLLTSGAYNRTEQRNVSFTFNRSAMSSGLKSHLEKCVKHVGWIDRLCGSTAMQPSSYQTDTVNKGHQNLLCPILTCDIFKWTFHFSIVFSNFILIFVSDECSLLYDIPLNCTLFLFPAHSLEHPCYMSPFSFGLLFIFIFPFISLSLVSSQSGASSACYRFFLYFPVFSFRKRSSDECEFLTETTVWETVVWHGKKNAVGKVAEAQAEVAANREKWAESKWWYQLCSFACVRFWLWLCVCVCKREPENAEESKGENQDYVNC